MRAPSNPSLPGCRPLRRRHRTRSDAGRQEPDRPSGTEAPAPKPPALPLRITAASPLSGASHFAPPAVFLVRAKNLWLQESSPANIISKFDNSQGSIRSKGILMDVNHPQRELYYGL